MRLDCVPVGMTKQLSNVFLRRADKAETDLVASSLPPG